MTYPYNPPHYLAVHGSAARKSPWSWICVTDTNGTILMAGKVMEFTDANFQTEVLGCKDPVLVDFWAPWCGPCKMIAPTIEELANDYAGRAKIGKVNTDDNPSIPSEYRISGIPTVILFKGGREVQRFVGLTQKPKLVQALDGLA